jgi:hypothetical protein
VKAIVQAVEIAKNQELGRIFMQQSAIPRATHAPMP